MSRSSEPNTGNPMLAAHWRAFAAEPSEAHFVPIYNMTQRLVWSLCVRLLHDEDDARDAFQSVYTRLLAQAQAQQEAGLSAAGGPPEAIDQTLLYRTIIREAQNLRARRARRGRREVPMETAAMATDAAARADDALAELQRNENLAGHIERLPDQYRVPLVLHYFEGLTQGEIGRILGRSRVTISLRIAAAMRRLRSVLSNDAMMPGAAFAGTATSGDTRIEPPAARRAARERADVKASLRSVRAAQARETGPPASMIVGASAVYAAARAHANTLAGAVANAPLGASGPTLLGTMEVKWALTILAMLAAGGAIISLAGGPPIIKSGTFAGWTGEIQEGRPELRQTGNVPQFYTPGAGRNYARWQSPEGWLQSGPGTLWRIRATVDDDNHRAGVTPLWALNLAAHPSLMGRTGNAAPQSREVGGAMALFFDVPPGANSPALAGQGGRGEFDLWYLTYDHGMKGLPGIGVPINSKPPNSAQDNATRLSLAIQLADAPAIVGGSAHPGSALTLRDVRATSYAMSKLKFSQPIFELPRLAEGMDIVFDNARGIVNPTFESDGLHLQPWHTVSDRGLVNVAASDHSTRAYDPLALALASVQPGRVAPAVQRATDATEPVTIRGNDPARRACWPVPWEPDTLYMITTEISATETLPSDSPLRLRVGMDSATSELSGYTWFGADQLPRAGEPRLYTAFFYSHSRPALDDTSWHGLRPRVSLDMAPGAPAGQSAGAIAIVVHSLRVYKVAGIQ